MAAFLCLSLAAYADEADENSLNNPGRVEKKIYHLYKEVEMTSAVRVSYDKPRIVVHAVYPQLQLQDGSSNESVDDFNTFVLELVDEEINRFKVEVQAMQLKLKTSVPPPVPTKTKNDLYIDFDTSILNSKTMHIASIRFSVQGLFGDVFSSYRFHRVLNYDLENNEKINLEDLFEPGLQYLTVLSQYTRNVLISRLGNKQMIVYGTLPLEENFQNWNIKLNGLLITFDQQQIAANSYGSQTVLVPFKVLKKGISRESVIASCVFQRKCSGHHLLTGGFIDEAINTRDRRFNPVFG